ncbi:MAG: SDR family NAD(P)-dependent oxidoreductase [Actinomycetota bacterium]
MSDDLQGRVAIVTGGGTGLGAEVCRQLVAAGARVGINYSRSVQAAEALSAVLGSAAVAVRADVRDEGQVAAMVLEVEERLGGPVDLLVNNAGVTVYAAPEDVAGVGAEDWERILGVNLIGAWNCVRAVVPGMRARGAGVVVNVASDAAFHLEGSSVPYVISKVGIVALTRVLAASLAPQVRVHAVAPGWMDTPWLDRYVPDEVTASLRAGEEPVVEVARVAREVIRLLGSSTTGDVVQMSV